MRMDTTMDSFIAHDVSIHRRTCHAQRAFPSTTPNTTIVSSRGIHQQCRIIIPSLAPSTIIIPSFPVFSAIIENCNFDQFQRLVRGERTLHVTSRWGWSPLFSACSNGNHEIAEFLLEQGADVNSANHRSANRKPRPSNVRQSIKSARLNYRPS